MKNNHLILSTMLLLSSVSFAQEEELFPLPEVPEEAVPENTTVEITYSCDIGHEPQFPGGIKALMTFLSNHLNYPERALKDSIAGKCWVRFIVKSDGNVSEVKIMQGVKNCPECDAEVIRVIRSMPRWIPGRYKDKAVNAYFDLPVNFSLD